MGAGRAISPLALRFSWLLLGFLSVEAGIYSAHTVLVVAVLVALVEGAAGDRSPVSWLIRQVRGAGAGGIPISVARRMYAVSAVLGATVLFASSFVGAAWSVSAIAMGCVAFVGAAVIPPRVSKA